MKNSILKTQTNKGMAMVMMLILVPVLMFLALSFVDPIVRSFRSAVNDQKTLLAKNVADSMFEVALWESRGTGVGENKKSGTEPIIKEYDFGTATVRWSVMATPEIEDGKVIEVTSGDKYYTIPSPGSGTAGDDYCNTNEPVVDRDSLTEELGKLEIDGNDLGDFYTAFDWPCNWNKLREGESVVIPLYTEDENGDVVHPFKAENAEFELRIRPPCDTDKITSREDEYVSEICKTDPVILERYELEGDAGLGGDTVIVLWEITGKQGDENGVDVVLTQLYDVSIFDDSALTVNVLNGNGFFESLNQLSLGRINDDDILQVWNTLNTLYKPTLRIMAVHQFRDTSDRTVPYLEYQFSAPINLSTDMPVASTSKVVSVEVMIDGGYSTFIERTVGIAKSISGFVIQQ